MILWNYLDMRFHSCAFAPSMSCFTNEYVVNAWMRIWIHQLQLAYTALCFAPCTAFFSDRFVKTNRQYVCHMYEQNECWKIVLMRIPLPATVTLAHGPICGYQSTHRIEMKRFAPELGLATKYTSTFSVFNCKCFLHFSTLPAIQDESAAWEYVSRSTLTCFLNPHCR